jgi:hypothetical protein
MPKKQKVKHGSALLLATILLFAVVTMVVGLTYITVTEQKMSQKTKSSVGSFFSSASGIEWALNTIATTDNPDTKSISSRFTMSGDKAVCPSGNSCEIYFLDNSGKVITAPGSAKISDIKAIRSVGTRGDETQRAIEVAVAAGGDKIAWAKVNGTTIVDGRNVDSVSKIATGRFTINFKPSYFSNNNYSVSVAPGYVFGLGSTLGFVETSNPVITASSVTLDFISSPTGGSFQDPGTFFVQAIGK